MRPSSRGWTSPIELTPLSARRLLEAPIIAVSSDPSLDGNVNGPALLRVPTWVAAALGRYYLYFAHHEGRDIRLAYADRLEGPWTRHPDGALSLGQSGFPTEDIPWAALDDRVKALVESGADGQYAHIASPDVVVDAQTATIRMYYHGRLPDGTQRTRVAVSPDGLHFEARDEVLGLPYFRAFRHGDGWYALAMPGVVYRSADGLTGFERGPMLFEPEMRHSALLARGNVLYVFWTRVGDAPERILVSQIDLAGDWSTWEASEPREVLRPSLSWEGADLDITPSRRGGIMVPANQLRDPAILDEGERITLAYSGAGEQALGLAELTLCRS